MRNTICCFILILIFITLLPAGAAEYNFVNNAYGATGDVSDIDDLGEQEDDNSFQKTTTNLARKAKKKAKGQPKIKIQNNLESNNSTVNNPPPQQEQVSEPPNPGSPPPGAPPSIYPCDASVECTILDLMLPPEACNNQCPPGTFCQGRHDMRIVHKPIAVCVPPPP